MIIAIQQPEHIPWVGFFNKMINSDIFVFLDNVQYKKRYFENRNRIRLADQACWVTIPVLVKGKYFQKLNEVEICQSKSWKDKYWGRLTHAYSKKEYWKHVSKIISPSLLNDYQYLVELNIELIMRIQNFFHIQTKVVKASEMNLKDNLKGSDLILQICKNVDSKTYISGPDGRNYLDTQAFKNNHIQIKYHDFIHPTYFQDGSFISHLSILDLIANLGHHGKEILESFKI